MSGILRIMAVAAATLTFPVTGSAQSAQQLAEPGGSQIRLGDTWTQFPYPSWQKTNNTLAETRLMRQQRGDTLILAMIPKNQKAQEWKNQYTLYGTFNETLTLRQFMNSSVGVFLAACGRENFKLRKVLRQPSSAIVVVYCKNSPSGPAEYGYGEGVGEVTLMWIGKHENSFIKVYEQWRGPKFDFADASSWPVSNSILNRSIARFSGIRLLPYTP